MVTLAAVTVIAPSDGEAAVVENQGTREQSSPATGDSMARPRNTIGSVAGEATLPVLWNVMGVKLPMVGLEPG